MVECTNISFTSLRKEDARNRYYHTPRENIAHPLISGCMHPLAKATSKSSLQDRQWKRSVTTPRYSVQFDTATLRDPYLFACEKQARFTHAVGYRMVDKGNAGVHVRRSHSGSVTLKRLGRSL